MFRRFGSQKGTPKSSRSKGLLEKIMRCSPSTQILRTLPKTTNTTWQLCNKPGVSSVPLARPTSRSLRSWPKWAMPWRREQSRPFPHGQQSKIKFSFCGEYTFAEKLAVPHASAMRAWPWSRDRHRFEHACAEMMHKQH